jgi:hypothetical protein
MGGGAISACGIGSGIATGSRLGVLFLAFVFRLTVRFAFFFEPFLAFRFIAKQ